MNMVQVIPAIIAKDLDDLKRKLDLVKNEAALVQLDVMDGKFVTEKSFGSELSDIESVGRLADVFFEIHLMVGDPLFWIKKWVSLPNVKRIIFHWEALKDPAEAVVCLTEIKNGGKETGLALNPKTLLEGTMKILPEVDLVLLMTVDPGRAGQKFQEEVIHKIQSLRSFLPGVKIEVDGGINLESAKKTVEAGADTLAVGSFAFSEISPADQIKKIEQAVNN